MDVDKERIVAAVQESLALALAERQNEIGGLGSAPDLNGLAEEAARLVAAAAAGEPWAGLELVHVRAQVAMATATLSVEGAARAREILELTLVGAIRVLKRVVLA